MLYMLGGSQKLLEQFLAALPPQTKINRFDSLAVLIQELTAGERVPAATVVIDAVSAVEDIRQIHSACIDDIRIIAVSGNLEERDAALAAGADDYLLRPFNETEIARRLDRGLLPLVQGGQLLMGAIVGSAAETSIDDALRQFAALADASAMWLQQLEPGSDQFRLLGQHNLPPLFAGDADLFQEETSRCQQNLTGQPQLQPTVTSCPYLINTTPASSYGMAYHLAVPLFGETELTGLLRLAFEMEPFFTAETMAWWVQFGQQLGQLLHIATVQHTLQHHSSQNAFLILLARVLNDKPDLQFILSHTLDVTNTALAGSGGAVWLRSENNHILSLASSTSIDLKSRPAFPQQVPVGDGLIGWVAKHSQPLRIDLPTEDPRSQPALDYPFSTTPYSLVAAPLLHHQTTYGVIAFVNERPERFSEQDLALLNGVAILMAAAIANARLVRHLRDYNEQQQILYAMSLQIATTLKLESTLHQAVIGMMSLLNTQTVLLWLLEPDSPVIRLATSLGVSLPDDLPRTIDVDQDIIGWVIASGEVVVSNAPHQDPNITLSFCNRLGLTLNNVLIVPMSAHRKSVGAICLINTDDGQWQTRHKTLAQTAAEMIAVAVGNAQLHTQTLNLLRERERWHHHIIQTERLVTVGRLTASLSHEINNPLQVIKGSMDLALEEIDDRENVQMYLELSRKESERVVMLLERMRKIYRPQEEKPGPVDLIMLLREAVLITRKELLRQNVQPEASLPSRLPVVTGVGSQLELVLVNLLLNLGDIIGQNGGGVLLITAAFEADKVVIKFTVPVHTATFINWIEMLESGKPLPQTEANFGLTMSYDVIKTHGGSIACHTNPQQTACTISFPVENEVQSL